jgi:hypothetical protein
MRHASLIGRKNCTAADPSANFDLVSQVSTSIEPLVGRCCVGSARSKRFGSKDFGVDVRLVLGVRVESRKRAVPHSRENVWSTAKKP